MGVAGGADGLEGAGEGAGAADLDDVVDAAFAGELEDLGIPVGGGAVVDGVVRTEGAGAEELFVRRAGDDDARAVELGDLEGKERDAAGAEDEDRLAGGEVALLDEGVPGGESGAGERGGLLVGEVCGRGDEAVLGEEAGGSEDAVDGAAEGGFCGGGFDLAGGPVLKEEAGDAVAALEAGDFLADGRHDAGGVGAGDARELQVGVVVAEDDHEVAVVEAGGVEGDGDLVRAGGRRLGGGEVEAIEAEGAEGEGCGHRIP